MRKFHLGVFDAFTGDASSTLPSIVSTFSGGVLNGIGNDQANTVVFSRNAAGTILVNNGAVPVTGGTPTVANTNLITASGLGGNDVITLNETNGTLPRAILTGGSGNDTLTGGGFQERISCSGSPKTTRSTAGVATTSCSAARATTSCSAARATTGWSAALASTRCSAKAATIA